VDSTGNPPKPLAKPWLGSPSWSLLGSCIYFLFCLVSSNYSGRTKYSACASKLSKLSGEYLCPQKTQKLRFFLLERSSAGEWIKILTDVKILKKLLHKMS
jgi:hypothetical protein